MTKPTHLYRHFDADDNLLYVGISINAYERFRNHRSGAEWANRAVKMTVEHFETRELAAQAEILAIQNEKPLFNIMHNNQDPQENKKEAFDYYENFDGRKISDYEDYYSNMAISALPMSKKTSFLAHLLYHMELDTKKNILFVDVSPNMKKEILKDIGAESKNPLILASQYLAELQKENLIKSVGNRRFIIDPLNLGYAKHIPVNVRNKASKICQSGIFYPDNSKHTDLWIIDKRGDRRNIQGAML